jgi:FdhE protein
MNPTTLDAWLDAHGYLRSVAEFWALVDRTAAGLAIEGPDIPDWDVYRGDFVAGVPLIRSSDAAIDLEPAGTMIVSLVTALATAASAFGEPADLRALEAELVGDGAASRRVVDWLLGDEGFVPSAPGLLRYVGWIAMARYLSPLVAAFDRWRDEEKWLRNYCPTCGSPPAMAQLVGVDPGRLRLLSCGCCGTRWRFGRTGCPFCEGDSQRLSALTVQGEGGLRIDHCSSCRGYIKTYDGQGNEPVLLSDWTSLHLDLVAQDRGLKRLATSLYDFPLPRPE